MNYISKGVVLQSSSKEKLRISRCGMEYTLEGAAARLWLRGRFAVAKTDCASEAQDLIRLTELGLADACGELGSHSGYQLLANCIICPAKLHPIRTMLTHTERWLWGWISSAGFRLTISELVYLSARQIEPSDTLSGRENWHNLIHTIYTTETIQDGVLLAAMEQSPDCQKTVDAVLGLLRKKRILLI